MKKTIIAKANAMDLDELKMPLVVCRMVKDGQTMYRGFVPGFEKEDIIDSNLEVVKLKLNTEARATVSKMLENNQPFPFFPDKEAISRDFDNVVYIKFIKLK